MERGTEKLLYRPLGGDEKSAWLYAGSIDEMKTAGCYMLQLQHGAETKGLPVEFCGSKHYIVAMLFVSDSGTDERMQKGRVIGQTIIMTARDTAETALYTRSCNLSGTGGEWSTWEKVTTGSGTVKVTWDANSSVNSFVEQGTYTIAGERLNPADGLPIANSNPGHTFSARLVVLDSSISGTGDSQDKCVTQLLTLSNRIGGDGDVYVRTGSSVSKNTLAGGSGWEAWGKLQQNIEVGQVTSLNSFIGNGIYSGVYSDTVTGPSGGPLHLLETFVMVVINNYAVAGATGQARSISQFKYALNIDGTFSCKTRTGQGSTGISWGNWVDLGAATTADIQDNSITAQKLSADVREKVNNPLRPLFVAAGAEYNDSGADKTKTAPWGETVTHKAGHYYLNGLGDITEEEMMTIYNAGTYKGTANYYAGYNDIRTFLPAKISGQEGYGAFQIKGAFADCKNIEVVCFSSERNLTEQYGISNESPDISNAFCNCKNLKYIQEIGLKANSAVINTFNGCRELVWIKLFKLAVNLSLAASSKISKESIRFVIQKAKPTSAITITLHPDAYARLADDADIVAALEAQPLVSLVSA